MREAAAMSVLVIVLNLAVCLAFFSLLVKSPERPLRHSEPRNVVAQSFANLKGEKV